MPPGTLAERRPPPLWLRSKALRHDQPLGTPSPAVRRRKTPPPAPPVVVRSRAMLACLGAPSLLPAAFDDQGGRHHRRRRQQPGETEEGGGWVCDLIKKGVRVDLGFKTKYLKDVAESVLTYCGRVVAPEQIYNHLRDCRAHWVHVSMVKWLEDVRWVEETTPIMMDDDAYFAHIMTHSRDSDLINLPITNYAQMKMIYTERVPQAPNSPTAIHRALSHLMEHNAQSIRCLAMTLSAGCPGLLPS
ncbi:hypothetical protein QYE76_054562 [Lolium multiflorum]|uniref:Uncharacterized protein n=1 Tax=Lolium multiflorum TaxID=4521 RepID=A0AAD8SXY5_LOLMU|nr:hypothetical protein QYE76_054562 [Lolium multiflorum]